MKTEVYIVGSNAALAETLDGGQNWHNVSDPGDEGHGNRQRINFNTLGPMSLEKCYGILRHEFWCPQHMPGQSEKQAGLCTPTMVGKHGRSRLRPDDDRGWL